MSLLITLVLRHLIPRSRSLPYAEAQAGGAVGDVLGQGGERTRRRGRVLARETEARARFLTSDVPSCCQSVLQVLWQLVVGHDRMQDPVRKREGSDM